MIFYLYVEVNDLYDFVYLRKLHSIRSSSIQRSTSTGLKMTNNHISISSIKKGLMSIDVQLSNTLLDLRFGAN